jgi:hypothetical protein
MMLGALKAQMDNGMAVRYVPLQTISGYLGRLAIHNVLLVFILAF